MPGKGVAPQRGKELQVKVVELARELGLRAETEVTAGRRLWGSRRRIDVVLLHEETRRNLGIECKYQKTKGTTEEKILATIRDIEFWPIPGIVVIAGEGFSQNMIGYLMSTGKVIWFDDLVDWLRLYFAL